VSHSPPHIMSFLDIPRGSCPQAIFRLKYHQLLSCFLGIAYVAILCLPSFHGRRRRRRRRSGVHVHNIFLKGPKKSKVQSIINLRNFT
jgi:hypothetical protein